MIEELFEDYGENLFRFLRRLLGNSDDAEDALQETFLALTRIPYIRNETAKQYVFKIAYSKAMDIFRRRSKEYADYTNEFEETRYILPNKTDASDIEEAMKVLNEKEKTAILLYYEDNYKYEEVAQIMEIPEGTVKTLLHRGKSKLKSILEVENG